MATAQMNFNLLLYVLIFVCMRINKSSSSSSGGGGGVGGGGSIGCGITIMLQHHVYLLSRLVHVCIHTMYLIAQHFSVAIRCCLLLFLFCVSLFRTRTLHIENYLYRWIFLSNYNGIFHRPANFANWFRKYALICCSGRCIAPNVELY